MPALRKQRIEYRPVDEIFPYEGNPRRNESAVRAVANSIKEFGFRSPIVVDADGTVIAGHTRLKAAKSLGMAEVPVIVAADLTPEQASAYRLADNKTGELAEWDAELLAQELDGLADLDMSDFGFKEADFEVSDEYSELDISGNVDMDGISLVVKLDNETEAEKLYDELKERGFECRISTL